MLNGTYNFTASCGSTSYVASPANGSYTIDGAQTVVNITFISNPDAYLTFIETGLPVDTDWSVNLTAANGTNFSFGTNTTGQGPTGGANQSSDSISGSILNGDYNFAIVGPANTTGSPSSGTLDLTSGQVVRECIEFSTPTGPNGTSCDGYLMTFNAIGLPNSEPFCAYVSNGFWSCQGAGGASPRQVVVGAFYDGDYGFTITAQGAYAPSPASGTVAITNANVTVSVSFSLGPSYAASFVESGLPLNTTWQVDLLGVEDSSTTDTVSVSDLPNGTYAYSVPGVSGFAPSAASGSFTVNGSAVLVNVTFQPAPATTYAVTFTETGLVAGTNWTVTLGNTSSSGNTSSLAFSVVAGDYVYSARATTSHNCTCSGNVRVAGPTAVSLRFGPDTYRLDFQATGLPSGIGWGVLMGTRSNSSLGDAIGFEALNGSYIYVIIPASGYTAMPSSGTVTVAGANVTVAIGIHPVLYPIVFIEFGLPTGSNWSVHLANTSLGINETANGSSNAITVFLPNGTYEVTFGLPPGYSSSPGSTIITVAGRTTPSVEVRTASSSASSPGEPPAWFWGFGLLTTAIGATGGVLIYSRWRPRNRLK